MNNWKCVFTPKEVKKQQQLQQEEEPIYEEESEKPKCLLDASIFADL